MIATHHPREPKQHLLRSLRELCPEHNVTLTELLELIAAQATYLRTAAERHTHALLEDLIASVPSMRIEDTTMPIAGYCFWDPHARQWVIRLHRSETSKSRRFILLHEFAHILWHPHLRQMFANLSAANRARLAEHAADIFAGEVLMPRHLVNRAHQQGVRTVSQLARHFNVSIKTMRWRLDQLDLAAPATRAVDRRQPVATHPRTNRLVEAA